MSADRTIVFVTSTFPRWSGDGSAPFMLDLARELRLLDWDVEVLAPHAPGAAVDEVMDGVRVHRFRYAWPANAQTLCYEGGVLPNLRKNRANAAQIPLLVAAELSATLRHLVRRRPAIVHSHWLLPQGFVAALAAQMTGTVHVATAHGSDLTALRGGIARAFKRLAITWSDAVTANSSLTEAELARLGADAARVARIPIGARVPPDLSATEVAALRSALRRGDGPLVVFVGRLLEQKGVADLLDAVAIARQQLPNITLACVGDGPDRDRFEVRALQRGIGDRVSFVGAVSPSRVAEYLRCADVFAGPAKTSKEGVAEAQGVVYAEAMLAGLPIVACDSGGIRDLVRDGETGLLVPEGDPAAIAGAITRLHANPALAHELAKRGLDAARDGYCMTATALRFSRLYESVLAMRRRPQPARRR
ncbi:MAG: glycosyltransferase [Steroidobacteraceae bacterium]